MNIKIFIGAILVGLIFFADFAEAYDLPKIKAEKTSTKKVEDKDNSMLKSDWSSMDAFEKQIKILTADKNLSTSAKERIYIDKNNIFIAVYKGDMYFLDKQSIKVKKNSVGEKSWRQRIAPLGRNVLPKNTAATEQKFFTDGEKFYNSFKQKNNLTEIEDDEDRKFLEECFKVGCFYAFGEEFLIEGDELHD